MQCLRPLSYVTLPSVSCSFVPCFALHDNNLGERTHRVVKPSQARDHTFAYEPLSLARNGQAKHAEEKGREEAPKTMTQHGSAIATIRRQAL